MRAAAIRAFGRRSLLLLLTLLLLCATGCGEETTSSSSESSSPSPTPTATPDPTPAPTGEISGMLLDFDDTLLTLRTDDGQEYTFYIGGVTITGLEGVYIGDRFTVSYTGELDPEKPTQIVTVTTVEKIGEAEESDSIPLAWKDNGVFASCYSKAYVALQSLSVEEKVGQLLWGLDSGSKTGSDVVTYHLGGYVTQGSDYEGKTRWQIQNMVQGWQSAAKIPLLIAVEEEGGDLAPVSSNSNLRGVPFRSPQLVFAMGGMEMVQSDAKTKAQLLLDLGINVNLAPVANVCTDPEDSLYSRTFGQEAEETAEYTVNVVQQFQKQGLSAVVKYFPGYTPPAKTQEEDSEVSEGKERSQEKASQTQPTLAQLETRELLPFQQAVDQGAYAIMMSHDVVSCLDDALPVCLSPAAHTYLRETMGFTGIILTGDLSSKEIAGKDWGLEQDVYVQAVLAGNDVLLCSDYQAAYESILAAVNSGVIPQETLDRAVFRILSWKCMLNLM